MKEKRRQRGMHIKGYYTRARVFGYMLLIVAIVYLIYYFYLRIIS